MRLAPAFAVAVLLASIVVGAFAALFGEAVRVDASALWADPYLHRVVGFTFWQASWSTLLSVGLALPVSRALARRRHFPGRVWLLRLLGLPLVVPSIVAVFGIVAVYGQSGLINRLAGARRMLSPKVAPESGMTLGIVPNALRASPMAVQIRSQRICADARCDLAKTANSLPSHCVY